MPNIHTLTDHLKFDGIIGPRQAAGAQNGAWVDVAGYDKFYALVHTGDVANGATLNAKIQQARDSAGAGAKDVAGAALAEVAAHATDNDNQRYGIDLALNLLDEGYTHVRIVVNASVASQVAADGILYRGYENPASERGLAQEVRKLLP